MPAVRKLTDAEIAGAAKAGGFTGAQIAKITAIALAESGGNPSAHNRLPPDNSYGLTQVNMIGSMGPARRKQFGLKNNEELFNPTVNMKAAHAISNGGTNFRPWSTYTSGAYLRYMSRANKAAGNPSSAPGGSGVEQTGLGASDSFAMVGVFFKFISAPETWLRLGMLAGGAILIGMALVQASGVSDKARALVNVLPQGKILNAAKTAATASKAA